METRLLPGSDNTYLHLMVDQKPRIFGVGAKAHHKGIQGSCHHTYQPPHQ
ncbi:hypothetical protein ACMA1I_07625 [Pontibacter sp. 13R65]